MLLKWDDSYTVGHAGLDGGHQQLFAALNRLISALDDLPVAGAEGEAAVLAAGAAFLAEFCQHSAAEEAIMDEFRYPHTERHARHHAFFIGALKTVLADEPNLNAIRTNLPFITSTVLDHIDRDDRDFGAHLLLHGLYGKI